MKKIYEKNYIKYDDLYFKYCHGLEEKALLRELPQSQKNFQKYIDFSSNDYLGLSNHPRIISGAKKALEKYGTNSGGSRLLGGSSEIFKELEQNIANSKKIAASIIFNSAYQANSSVLAALLKNISNPLILTDKFIHASMYEGLAISQLRYLRYKHLDMNHLEDLLKENKSQDVKFIFSETVFSMDGDVLDLENIKFLSHKYNAFLVLDEAHSIGIYGNNGYGVSLNEGIVIGSFSKSLGSLGGFVSCSDILKSYLINHSKGFMYSTALPPSVIGANLAAWQFLPELKKERKKIKQHSNYLRTELSKAGFNIGNSSSHIIPIIIGSIKETLLYANYLKQNGILVSAIRSPSVPPNTARLRISITKNHSKKEVDLLLDTLKNYKSS